MYLSVWLHHIASIWKRAGIPCVELSFSLCERWGGVVLGITWPSILSSYNCCICEENMSQTQGARCHNQFHTPLLSLLPKFNIHWQLLDVIVLEAGCLVSPSSSAQIDFYSALRILLFIWLPRWQFLGHGGEKYKASGRGLKQIFLFTSMSCSVS